jgi:predicted nucleic acid-binding protein
MLQQLGIAAITAAELLIGAHRAAPVSRLLRRQATVERLLAAIPILPFDLAEARVYAAMAAEITRQGLTIGTKDIAIAATAAARGWAIATLNRTDFARIPGVDLVESPLP